MSTVPALSQQEVSQQVSEDDGAHDQADGELLRELSRLRSSGDDGVRQSEIIGELISGWEPLFSRWLVLKVGRQDGDEVTGRVVERLVRLLLRTHEFNAPWGAVVWRTVKDEAFRYHRTHRRELSVAEVYPDPDTAPSADPFDELKLDPDNDARRLTELVAHLSERDQLIIQLTVLDERPRPEAAAALGIKINALDQAKHRALERLAKLAARHGVSNKDDQDEKKT